MAGGEFARARLEHLNAVMTGYVERGQVPGLVTLVSRRGEVHVHAAGTLDRDGRAPMRRDTIFRIASMTKPIAAAAAMILVEECRVRLDDPVDDLLPELAHRRVLARLDGPLDETVPACRPITLRDLLTMRLGLGHLMVAATDWPILRALQERRLLQGPPMPGVPPEPDEWMRRVGSLPLACQPGERWLYDLGLDILGVLIARAAGRPLEVFLRDRIFAPLGMKDTAFSVSADRIDRLATSYAVNPASGALDVYDPAAGGQWSTPPAFPSASGGLVSTVDDYLAFGQMMLNRGTYRRERILSSASVALMTSDQLTAAQKAVSGLVPGYFDSHGWGFGLAVVTRRDDVGFSVGSYGWDGGLGTSWYADPREDMITILLTQRMWTSPVPPPVHRDFWTAAYAAIGD